MRLHFRGIYSQVYGEMDEDGFYHGECNSQSGLVPSNMVKELLGGKGERSERKQRNGLEKRSHSNEPGARSALSGSDEDRSYSAAAASAAGRGDRPRSTAPTKVPPAFSFLLHSSLTCTCTITRETI